MDALWPHLSDIGGGALFVGVCILVLTGRLVPGKERDYWRAAFFAEQAKTQKLTTVTGEVQRDFLNSLTRRIAPDRGEHSERASETDAKAG